MAQPQCPLLKITLPICTQEDQISINFCGSRNLSRKVHGVECTWSIATFAAFVRSQMEPPRQRSGTSTQCTLDPRRLRMSLQNRRLIETHQGADFVVYTYSGPYTTHRLQGKPKHCSDMVHNRCRYPQFHFPITSATSPFQGND